MVLLFLFSSCFALFDVFNYEEHDTSFISKYSPRNDLDPVILIPGFGGSRIEFKEKNETKWKNLWLDSKRAVPPFHKSWIADLSVSYNVTTDSWTIPSHIDARPADYGGEGGVKCIDPLICSTSGYYNTLLKALYETGYKMGQNVFGAPFDWRIANAKQILTNGMCNNLRILIENAYRTNGNKKVHLVSHSLGTSFVHVFLTKFVTPTWRAQHISSFVCISPVMGGSFEAFAHIASPHKWGRIPIPSSLIHQLAQDMGGIFWLMPNTFAFPKDRVLGRIASINKTITIQNSTWTFSSTNRTNRLQALQMTIANTAKFDPPRVPTHVMYSKGRKTTKEIVFAGTASNWWEKESDSIKGDGDGTVPIESLVAPMQWASQQTEKITSLVVNDVSHSKIIHHETIISAIRDIVSRNK